MLPRQLSPLFLFLYYDYTSIGKNYIFVLAIKMKLNLNLYLNVSIQYAILTFRADKGVLWNWHDLYGLHLCSPYNFTLKMDKFHLQYLKKTISEKIFSKTSKAFEKI